MSLRHRTILHRAWGALVVLLGLGVLLIAATGLAVVPEMMADERQYLRATPCPSNTLEPAEDCLHTRPARVAGTVVRDEPKHEEFTLRLRKTPGFPGEIDMGGAGPLLEHLTPGDEVTVTLWRDYAVAVRRGGTVQNTADTPEGEAMFVTAVVLALISAGAFLLHTGGSALVRARTWARDGIPAVLAIRAKWAAGSALCTLAAFLLADLSGLGPAAGVVAWCAMVPILHRYLRRRFSRVHGRHARPLTTRSPMR